MVEFGVMSERVPVRFEQRVDRFFREHKFFLVMMALGTVAGEFNPTIGGMFYTLGIAVLAGLEIKTRVRRNHH